MYPTLSDLINEFLGVYIPLPIQTYGFFVALAFLTSGYILMLELRRKEKEGRLSILITKELKGEAPNFKDIASSVLVGFLLGFKLGEAFLHYSDFVANPQDFILSLRGSWVAGVLIAILSGLWTFYEKNKERLPQPEWHEKKVSPYELAGNMMLTTAIFGLLGTKVFHILENLDQLAKDPMGTIFSFSGLSFFGGLIFGGLSLLVYANRNGVKPLHTLDGGAMAVSLGYGIGRIGCQLSGDGCWGINNPNPKPFRFMPDWLWSSTYPHNVINEGVKISDCVSTHCHQLGVPVYPTSIYETLMMVTIFIILWNIRKRIKIAGVIFSAYFVLQGIERFCIEQVRVNNLYHIFGKGITQAEIISVLLMILGTGGIIYFVKNKVKFTNY